MNAMKCDRCGKFYTENKNKYKDEENKSVCLIELKTEHGLYKEFYKYYDLCDDCVNELMIFLNGKNKGATHERYII